MPEAVFNGESRTIKDPPDLLPEEKDFTLTGTRVESELYVHSDIATVTRYLIEHPAVEITNVRESEGAITGVTGKIPRSLVKLGAKPRSNDGWSYIVSSGELRGKDD